MALLSRSFVRRRVIALATTLSVMATSFALAQDPTTEQRRRATGTDTNEQLFLVENDLAMSNMNREMLAKATGDVDRDFVDMMVPHHQAAVDMARAELKYGHNEALRRLAQTIVAQQQNEISEMRGAIGETSPAQPGGAPQPQSSAGSSAPDSPAAMSAMKMN
jgi:uncharacterized protein (DUF305 family)